MRRVGQPTKRVYLNGGVKVVRAVEDKLRAIRCTEIGIVSLETDDEAKWVHVATEGHYLGYRGGQQPFALTRAMFNQAVVNIRTHAQFSLGADGVTAVNDVIPWDFDHASEGDPNEGDKPVTGTPARGWTRDLKVVDGPDGKAQLHALTRFLEPARSYVKAGAYKWASISAQFAYKDPETNANKGMVITAIALTNRPFLQMLDQLAASDRQRVTDGEDVALRYHYFSRAETPEEAVCSLKELFGLPATAGVAELLLETAKLRGWIEAGNTPLGVDSEGLVCCIRQILGMDLLEPIAAALDKVPAIVQRLVEEKAMADGSPIPLTPPGTANASARDGDEDMELLKVLATALGVRENEDSVVAAVKELVSLSASLSTLFSVRDEPKLLLAAADKESKAGGEARTKLGALLKALGVEDSGGAVDKIASLMSQAKELATVMPELTELRTAAVAASEAAATNDVDAVILSRGWDASLKDALLLERKAMKPEAFATKYPVDKTKLAAAGARQQPHLTQALVAGPGAQQLSAAQAAQATGQPIVAVATDVGGVKLSDYPGTTPTLQAISYLKTKLGDSFAKLSWEDQCKQAWKFIRENNKGATAA